jgi:hypothetical protein
MSINGTVTGLLFHQVIITSIATIHAILRGFRLINEYKLQDLVYFLKYLINLMDVCE